MSENVWTKKKIILISCLAVIAIIILIFQLLGNKKESDIKIVTSSSKFYTVSNCVYRYITYLQSQDVDSLISVLDSSYKKSNNIVKDNVLDKLGTLNSNYNFEARKMYQQTLNENTTKYYVYGYLYEDTIDQNMKNKQDYYIIVTLDTEDKIFSITPYDGEIFISGGNR